mmetsp:Transcript_14714/g.21650  ORF Transcript_14714/g.21650 Transcript_14714/m.21650 type:complete len:247 (-) Transcript_14714:751-1491(-)
MTFRNTEPHPQSDYPLFTLINWASTVLREPIVHNPVLLHRGRVSICRRAQVAEERSLARLWLHKNVGICESGPPSLRRSLAVHDHGGHPAPGEILLPRAPCITVRPVLVVDPILNDSELLLVPQRELYAQGIRGKREGAICHTCGWVFGVVPVVQYPGLHCPSPRVLGLQRAPCDSGLVQLGFCLVDEILAFLLGDPVVNQHHSGPLLVQQGVHVHPVKTAPAPAPTFGLHSSLAVLDDGVPPVGA